MALVCIIETFWFLTGVGRFVAMALEFGAYIGIVVLLLRHPAFVSRFSDPRTMSKNSPAGQHDLAWCAISIAMVIGIRSVRSADGRYAGVL
jgi:hypothetical protein